MAVDSYGKAIRDEKRTFKKEMEALLQRGRLELQGKQSESVIAQQKLAGSQKTAAQALAEEGAMMRANVGAKNSLATANIRGQVSRDVANIGATSAREVAGVSTRSRERMATQAIEANAPQKELELEFTDLLLNERKKRTAEEEQMSSPLDKINEVGAKFNPVAEVPSEIIEETPFESTISNRLREAVFSASSGAFDTLNKRTKKKKQ